MATGPLKILSLPIKVIAPVDGKVDMVEVTMTLRDRFIDMVRDCSRELNVSMSEASAIQILLAVFEVEERNR